MNFRVAVHDVLEAACKDKFELLYAIYRYVAAAISRTAAWHNCTTEHAYGCAAAYMNFFIFKTISRLSPDQLAGKGPPSEIAAFARAALHVDLMDQQRHSTYRAQ